MTATPPNPTGRQPWPGQLCGATHRGMLCDRQQGHQGDHVDINGPLPDHTWTGTDQTEGEALTFFERRASRDPSIDHSSHSTQWVGKCPECPSDAPVAATEPAARPAVRNAAAPTDPGARDATSKRPESLSGGRAATEGTHQ